MLDHPAAVLDHPEAVLAWREAVLAWREAVLAWREALLAWREALLAWPEAVLAWREAVPRYFEPRLGLLRALRLRPRSSVGVTESWRLDAPALRASARSSHSTRMMK